MTPDVSRTEAGVGWPLRRCGLPRVGQGPWEGRGSSCSDEGLWPGHLGRREQRGLKLENDTRGCQGDENILSASKRTEGFGEKGAALRRGRDLGGRSSREGNISARFLDARRLLPATCEQRRSQVRQASVTGNRAAGRAAGRSPRVQRHGLGTRIPFKWLSSSRPRTAVFREPALCLGAPRAWGCGLRRQETGPWHIAPCPSTTPHARPFRPRPRVSASQQRPLRSRSRTAGPWGGPAICPRRPRDLVC